MAVSCSGTPGQHHATLGVVDGQVSKHEGFRRLGPFRRFPLAQGRPDPGRQLRRREGLDDVAADPDAPTEPPNAPRTVRIVGDTNTSLTLTWGRPLTAEPPSPSTGCSG